MRAERKAGQLLAKGDKAKGGRPSKENPSTETRGLLKDLGITYDQSSQWQRLGAMPQKDFDYAIGNGPVVDGRNRLRACEIAGVEPRFEIMQFEDDEAIKAFVADKSEHRNISKGQKAMRIAWLWPEPDKRGRGNKGKATETVGFSQQR